MQGIGLIVGSLADPRSERSRKAGDVAHIQLPIDTRDLVERIGHDVYVVQGSERNIKITKPADMELARFYLHAEQKKV